jgi:hypothetical protein
MTTSAVSAVLAQTSSATFQAWVTEVVTALFTTIGVTQTTDTGQINPATVSVPVAANTSAGYVIGRFNDTLQSTSPVFFKLEFGSGTAAANPMMWLTVGSSSNGSGTIGSAGGGAVTTRVACLNNALPNSTTTAYISRYVYLNTAQIGYLGVVFKYGSVTAGTTSAAGGGFHIFRTTDASGNATSTGVAVLTSAASATGLGNSASTGIMQCISYTSNTILPPLSAANSLLWMSFNGVSSTFLFGLTTTLEGSTAFVTPVYTIDPVIRFSAYVGVALAADFAVGSTSTFAMVGSTTTTFISAGFPFGCTTGFGGIGNPITFVMPWQ